MEKRLFYRDPSTGIEEPLLVYKVDTEAVSQLQISKQDKTDNDFETTNKTVTGAVNELKELVDHAIIEPYTPGTAGQVLVCDGSGGCSWQSLNVTSVYDSSTQSTTFVITFGN